MQECELLTVPDGNSFFSEIVKLGLVEDESQVARTTQVEEINFQMQVRSANMVSLYPRFL